MNFSIKFLFFLFIILSPCQLFADSSLSVSVVAELMVDDSSEAGDKMIEWAQQRMGYFLQHSDNRVIIRVPDFNADDFLKILKNTGDIINYFYSTENQDDEIAILEGQLVAKEKLLAVYYNLMSGSDYRSTINLEKEIEALLGEIDRAKGRIEKLINNRDYAMLEINFQSDDYYRETDTSTFDWINSIDFIHFMNEQADYE